MLINDESKTFIRISDFIGVLPSITGKVELVYEGEQEGPGIVANNLVGKAIRSQFVQYFPNPEAKRKEKEKSPYQRIINWFGEGKEVDLLNDLSNSEYRKALNKVPGLSDLVKQSHKEVDEDTHFFLMEFALHGLAEYSQISKQQLTAGTQFKDLLSSMFSMDRLRRRRRVRRPVAGSPSIPKDD